jgi:acetylornithine deacetylase/succinyl-diaminopimelate desuccinylase-like protein
MSYLDSRLDAHIDAHLDHYIEQLSRLCAQPSVSAQNFGIDECAALVAAMLGEEGFLAEIMPSDGYPVVYGEAAGETDKTLLLYLHYDVQPPEPLDLWESPPFELTRRGDRLYARGVSDDKGHIITRLAALAAVRDVMGGLPCRIKWVVEGEEEIGSPSMEAFVARHRDKLAADACIWEFGGVDFEGNPTLTLGMRGIFYVELSVRTAAKDAHSGLGGSLFANAAWRLTWALGSLKDAAEHIRIPGFYEDVRPASARDLALLARLPDQFDAVKTAYQLNGFLRGETDPERLKHMAVFEPTCTICGLTAGYQGPGSKTVQPAEARAKVDFRLVPDQDPHDIAAKLRAHLDGEGFADVAVKVLGAEHPAKVDPDDPFVRLTAKTAASIYGREPVIEPIIGGSGPLYPFVQELGVPVVSAGIGYPGGQAHAPNEHIVLSHLRNGIRHTARIIAGFADN